MFLIYAILNVIKYFNTTILTPIDLIISHVFPNFQSYVDSFNHVINTYLANNFPFFINLLPRSFSGGLYVFIGFFITVFSITVTLHVTLKFFRIVKNIKFW